MSERSNIEWTDATWPVVQGCNYKSPGCANCYAVNVVNRQAANPNPKVSGPVRGLVEKRNGSLRWTGKVACRGDRLGWPLQWREPRMIFVPSHGDLFDRSVPDAFIRKVFAVMSCCGQHTFQVLTKEAKRMRQWFADKANRLTACQAEWTGDDCAETAEFTPSGKHRVHDSSAINGTSGPRVGEGNYWPLPNVWLGVSVEDQARADKRIPDLLHTPAAVRFLSCEPLLSPLDLLRVKWPGLAKPGTWREPHRLDVLRFGYWSEQMGFVGHSDMHDWSRPLDWIIVGGESGPNARPCRIDCVRSLVDQCRAARVACFVKQLGSNARCATADMEQFMSDGCAKELHTVGETTLLTFADKKGGDPSEWPEDLRVRQFPEVPCPADPKA